MYEMSGQQQKNTLPGEFFLIYENGKKNTYKTFVTLRVPKPILTHEYIDYGHFLIRKCDYQICTRNRFGKIESVPNVIVHRRFRNTDTNTITFSVWTSIVKKYKNLPYEKMFAVSDFELFSYHVPTNFDSNRFILEKSKNNNQCIIVKSPENLKTSYELNRLNNIVFGDITVWIRDVSVANILFASNIEEFHSVNEVIETATASAISAYLSALKLTTG